MTKSGMDPSTVVKLIYFHPYCAEVISHADIRTQQREEILTFSIQYVTGLVYFGTKTS